jgi:glycosyltransferase involved in cell wall biosynthesis
MPSRPTGSDSTDSALAATELPPHACQLLAAGDLDGYRELFSRIASIADPHRRYWAGRTLVEAGLDAGAQTPPERLPALFAKVADGALELLEREPAEPVLLGHAGAALYELGSLDAAETMFDAARRLDPKLAGHDLKADTRSARRTSIDSAAPPMTELAARAAAIAARAQPAEGLRLSLCMIVRDEQEMLPRCLSAVADAVDEIVVVDTGSSDATVEIASSFGAQVLEHPWNGSFADARNASFDAATGDWLMYLDADEVLIGEDLALLRSLIGRTWREAFSLTEINYTGELHDGSAVTHDALRVFRARPEYRFEGRVHEQIAARLPAYLPERVEASGVRIEHYGYLAAVRVRRGKSERNIELLQIQQAEDDSTPFLHFNLGSEYAAAGDLVSALAEFERSWALLADVADLDSHEFAPALMSRMVKALRVCGLHADAIARAEEGLARFPAFTDLIFEQALAAGALGEADRAIELLERCIEIGDAPPRYAATVGCGSHLARVELAELLLMQRRYAEAARVAGEVSNDEPLAASARRAELFALMAGGEHAAIPAALVRAHASGMDEAELEVLGAWHELALGGESHVELSEAAVAPLAATLETLLRAQDFETFEMLLALLSRTPFTAREQRELLAEMYLRHGFVASAAEEWMAVCGEDPDVRALLGLARVAATRGMAREASEFAAAALSQDPHNAEAADLLSRAGAEAV